MSLLKESFAGINARFHLVGITTLLELLLPMAIAAAGKDEEWTPALVAGLFVTWGVGFAIQGLVYHAAVDDARSLRPSGVHLGLRLFPTLLWLKVKMGLLCFVPLLTAALAWQVARTPGPLTEAAIQQAGYWVNPVGQTAFMLLATAATPVAIWLREHGRRGQPIIDGVRFFVRRPRQAGRILALFLPAAIVYATTNYLRGPALDDPAPRWPDAFGEFLVSYVSLVALFAASRVMVRTAAPPPDSDVDRARV